jgi:UDP-glucose 4-epimerase
MNSRDPLNVLVTGGSGFVGSALVAELIKRGHRVVATTREVSGRLPAARNLSWVAWDVLNESLPQVDWAQFGAIVHLAVPSKLFDFPRQASQIYDLTVAATFRLLETARNHGVGRVLVASTGDVLGSSERPSVEDDILYMPTSFYGTAKACAELLVRSYQSVLSTAILRFYHPYGPRGPQFLINRLVRSVVQQQEIRIEGENGITLNPVWIDDLAHGVCLAIESQHTGVFHFAGPETLSLRELVNLIGTLAKTKPVLLSEPVPCIQRHAGAFEMTRQILGYHPQMSLRDGISRLLEDIPS